MSNQVQYWATRGNFPIKYSGTSEFKNKPKNFDNNFAKINMRPFSDVSNNSLVINWQSKLPANLNVFEKVDRVLPNVSNSGKKEQIVDFVKTFKTILLFLTKDDPMRYFLPPMFISENENSTRMEWIFKDFRIVFSFCENFDESYWFLVSNRNLNEFSLSGAISREKMDKTLSNLIQLVLRFS